MTQMSYEVRTPLFQGPLDLLLHLILRDEVDLYALSLAELVDAYLDEMDRILSEAEAAEASGTPVVIDLETATEFLLIAATLVELKTRRLLPATDDGDLDDELAVWEERDLLLARLLECKTFKNAAAVLRDLVASADMSVPRRAGPDERYLDMQPDVLAGVGADDLARAYLRALTPRPEPQLTLDHVAAIRVTVTDVVAELVEILPRAGQTSFRALTAHLTERLEVVIRFLAVLELFKQGLVDLTQTTTFGEIQVRWTGDDHHLAHEAAALVDSYDG
jgi:segregation and condensation protein A